MSSCLSVECDGQTGDVIREFVWLGDMLVATIEHGQMYAVHGGHLGQPLMATDAVQSIVWQAELTPFGAALPIVDGDDPGLRFPGQWVEAETGLLQNWHRDYDPSLGRYIEADPLGLDAGQSLYGYVGQDPLGWIDPEGLDVTITLKGYRLSGVPGALGNGHAFVGAMDNTTGKKIGVRAGPVRGLRYQPWTEAFKED